MRPSTSGQEKVKLSRKKQLATDWYITKSENVDKMSDEDEEANIKPKNVPGEMPFESREQVAQNPNKCKGAIPTRNNPIGHRSPQEYEINTSKMNPISVPPHHMSLDYRKKCSEQK